MAKEEIFSYGAKNAPEPFKSFDKALEDLNATRIRRLIDEDQLAVAFMPQVTKGGSKLAYVLIEDTDETEGKAALVLLADQKLMESPRAFAYISQLLGALGVKLSEYDERGLILEKLQDWSRVEEIIEKGGFQRRTA